MNHVRNFTGTYEAQAPISHGSDEDFGMEVRLRTLEITVRDDGEVYHEDVPVISGNSLRGQLRDLLAEDFLDRLSTEGDTLEISDTLSSAFYSGGSLERTAGAGKLNRRLIHGIRDNIPPLSLLGTAIEDQMIEGRIDVGQLLPIAFETNSYTGYDEEKSVFDFVDKTFYTRQDDRVGGRQDGEDAQQMKYDVQVLVPGTRLHHDLTLRSGHTNIEAACLGHAFELFGERAVIGGMSSRGHGKVEFEYEDGLPNGDAYREWIDENRADIREFVEELDEQVS
jgi:CRISPR/Cas system CSM-associated protein Csm3 (group 7 of RAMP superfamily)